MTKITRQQIEDGFRKLKADHGEAEADTVLENIGAVSVAAITEDQFVEAANELANFGVFVVGDDNAADDDAVTSTAKTLNGLADEIYRKPENGTDLRAAVADGASPREAMDQMGQAANTLRKMDAKKGDGPASKRSGGGVGGGK